MTRSTHALLCGGLFVLALGLGQSAAHAQRYNPLVAQAYWQQQQQAYAVQMLQYQQGLANMQAYYATTVPNSAYPGYYGQAYTPAYYAAPAVNPYVANPYVANPYVANPYVATAPG